MRSFYTIFSACVFLFAAAALHACYQPYHGPQDASSDPDAESRDMILDETRPPDLPDVAPEPDLIPDPIIDLAPDLDGDEFVPDWVEAADDIICNVGVVGDPCSSTVHCSCVPSSARECLLVITGYVSFPGGYCSARCTSNADCGEGSHCFENTPGTRYCFKHCTSATQCRMAEGYTCTMIPVLPDSSTYCFPMWDTFPEG